VSPAAEEPLHRALGLTDDEFAAVGAILGREPNHLELALYAVMWSEHCSYKSSKVHLRNLAPDPDQARHLLAGIGANAGVVDIGQGYAVTFKIESHNHPSFVEPHQGAATGIGGIVRDIIAMGARPIAVMDALRFGPADAHDTARVLPGVARGAGRLHAALLQRAAVDDESEVRFPKLGAVEGERPTALRRPALIPDAHALVREHECGRQVPPRPAELQQSLRGSAQREHPQVPGDPRR